MILHLSFYLLRVLEWEIHEHPLRKRVVLSFQGVPALRDDLEGQGCRHLVVRERLRRATFDSHGRYGGGGVARASKVKRQRVHMLRVYSLEYTSTPGQACNFRLLSLPISCCRFGK